MFNLNLKQGLYAIIGIVFLLLLTKLYWLGEELEDYRNKLATEKASKQICLSNEEKLEMMLDKQSKANIELAEKYKKSKADFDAWKAKPAEVKYKWRTKIVKGENECENLKNIVNAYDNLSF